MADAANVVRSFFEAMQAREWEAAASFIDSDARIDFTETRESFNGDGFMAMNKAYPEGWTISVLDCFASGERVAAHVRVDQGTTTFWCSGFYTVNAGQIRGGVEHWVTEGSEAAPEWRSPYTL